MPVCTKLLIVLMPVLLASCQKAAPAEDKPANCRLVTFVLVNVHDRSAELSIGDRPMEGLNIVPPEQHGMASGSIRRRICGDVAVRFRSGGTDVSQRIDASGDLNIVYIDPTVRPIIQPTNHPFPLLD